ncbi:MAG: phosphoenolpyruvate carboxykinase (ATP) [Candidatus Melainabacteria bacterium]|nr:phosphoenolpyruvate carboxykinase (ATP) [Candidatus Melainabacteria bacterium]
MIQNNRARLNLAKASHNLKTAQLYELAIKNGEAQLSDRGALVTNTGKHTGRSANDKFIVKDAETETKVNWGKINKPISIEAFARIRDEVLDYLSTKELHVQDTIAGADPKNCVYVEIITETAFHGLFARNMLSSLNTNSAVLSYGEDVIDAYKAEYSVYHAPHYQLDPSKETELNSGTAILVNYSTKEVVIVGTEYAGEIKKSVFSLLNYLYPQRGIMPMHCSANASEHGEVSIFFGLSGTGKTTLSADPERKLIGDDEHGWSDEGVFNFEDGCYAKSIALTPRSEPEIYAASCRFGATIENVVMNDKRELDYFDKSITENGRVSYPIHFIPNSLFGRFVRKQPKNIIMLTCDAFGVLPAVSKLSPEEASEHFMLGYTAKIPGTEMGVTEPKAVFSPCFGAPFMPLAPKVYGDLLKDRISHAKVNCWLVNTGWAGGKFGEGKRMPLSLTRSIIHRINNGSLAQVKMVKHPILGLEVPESIDSPETQWRDQAEYKKAAESLMTLFKEQQD